MARKLKEIQDLIIAQKQQYTELDGLNSTSKVAVWRLWVYVVAYIIWTLELIFDAYQVDVNTSLAELKPHTLKWYRNKALSFLYGFNLVADSDIYNTNGFTQEQIKAAKIITYCSVIESIDNRLVVKVATGSAGNLSPITIDQQNSFKTYLEEIRDAGVKITVINYLPDRLMMNLRIFRNALLLDNEGTSILNGNKPIEDAINNYLLNLPFNGEISAMALVDAIQKAEGVLDVALDSLQSAWIDPLTNGYGIFTSIDVKRVPQSGYYKFSVTDNNFKSVINYVV